MHFPGPVQHRDKWKEDPEFLTDKGHPTRGHLIPYMFIIVVDVLSRQVTHVVEKGALEGIQIKQTCPTIHHFLFADEFLFFIKADRWYAMILKEILDVYNKSLGQRINLFQVDHPLRQ